MGLFTGSPGGVVYYDPNNEYARNYVDNQGTSAIKDSNRLFGNVVLNGNDAGMGSKYGLSRDPNVLKSSSSGNKAAASSVSGGIPNQPEATALDIFKIKDKEDINTIRKKTSNSKGNKSLTIPVGNGGGVSMVGKV